MTTTAVSAASAPTDGAETPPERSGPDRTALQPRVERVGLGPLVASVGAAGLLVVAFVVGDRMLDAGIHLQLRLPPLTGAWDWRPGRSAVPAVLTGGIGGFAFLALVRRARWSIVVAAAGALSLGWSVALGFVDGIDSLSTPLLSNQYLRTAALITDLHGFLGGFVGHIHDYNIHTRGHPPGFVVILWGLDRLGVGGLGANTVVVLVGGAVGVMAALVTARDVAGELTARRAAVFVALTPAALWWSSGDAFFSGVAMVAIMLLVSATSTTGRRSDGLALAGGACFVLTAYLSYGLVLLAVVPVGIALRRRRVRPLAVAGLVGLALVVVVTAVSGFWWGAGLLATRHEYFAGVASRRPYEYFVFANLAVFVLMIGPAAVAGLGRLRGSPAGPLVVTAVLAVVLADVSGMSKAEVERIWIPFVPLVAVAAATVAGSVRRARWWLSAQLAVTVLLAVGVRSPW